MAVGSSNPINWVRTWFSQEPHVHIQEHSNNQNHTPTVATVARIAAGVFSLIAAASSTLVFLATGSLFAGSCALICGIATVVLLEGTAPNTNNERPVPLVFTPRRGQRSREQTPFTPPRSTRTPTSPFGSSYHNLFGSLPSSSYRSPPPLASESRVRVGSRRPVTSDIPPPPQFDFVQPQQIQPHQEPQRVQIGSERPEPPRQPAVIQPIYPQIIPSAPPLIEEHPSANSRVQIGSHQPAVNENREEQPHDPNARVTIRQKKK